MLYRGIVIYFIIVLFYFKINHIEKNRVEKFMFSIFVPIFGFITVVLTENIKIMNKNKTEQENRNTEKERSKEYLMNIQSALIDNLTIKDYEKAREIILSTKSLKLQEQCKICHIAIKSKNVEISHISAVSLMKIQGYFERVITHMELKTDLSKIENLKKYIDSVYKYLQCDLLQGELKRSYQRKLIKSIEELISRKEKSEEVYYIILIENCIQLSEYDKAKEYLREKTEVHGTSEQGYRYALKIYIATKDKKNLYDTLKKIKSNLELKENLKGFLDFWGEEMVNGKY